MKKTLIALAAVASTAAFAQSTVTIDGVLDVGIRKLDSSIAAADTGWHLANSTNNQIRFRATEDLGGGLKANVVAAMRFDPTSGYEEGVSTFAQRPFFQGETTIGLSGNFGAVKMGRSLTPAQVPLAGLGNPWGTDTVASVALGGNYFTDETFNANLALTGNTGGQGRTDHIQYTSPNFNGFTGAIGYGFKQRTIDIAGAAGINADDSDTNDLISVAVTYAGGPLSGAFVYESNRGLFGTANSQDKVTGFGGAYDFGVAKAYAGYVITDFGGAANKEKAYALGADIPMGAATFKVGYRAIDNRAGGANDETKLGVGVYYSLSKRTTAYTNYGSTKRSEDNSRRNGFDIGLRHSF